MRLALRIRSCIQPPLHTRLDLTVSGEGSTTRVSRLSLPSDVCLHRCSVANLPTCPYLIAAMLAVSAIGSC